MFGGLSLEGPAAGPSQIGLDALMGLGSPQALVQSPAAGASTDLFGGLSVGGQQPYTQEQSHVWHAHVTALVCAAHWQCICGVILAPTFTLAVQDFTLCNVLRDMQCIHHQSQ